MNLLRNVVLIGILVLFVAAVTAHAEVEGTTLDLGVVKATVTIPAGFKQNESTPTMFFDEGGKKGSMQFLATPMPMPEETYAAMYKAALDTGRAQVKAGAYTKAEELTIDGLKGVLIVESAKDPSIRRLQWQAYGRGGYFNFTFASPTDAFEGYLAGYEAALKAIKFVK